MSSINLVLSSEFDIKLGPQIKRQYPLTTPLLKDQLSFLSEIVIPDQLHNKSVDKEDYTLFPIYWNPENDEYSYKPVTDNNSRWEQLILFTVCNYKYDSSINRNYSIKSLSIITRLPFFINLKPLMIMLLEDLFKDPSNFDPIISFYNEINNHKLYQLSNLVHLQKFTTRLCYLEFLKANEFNTDFNKFEIIFGSNHNDVLSQYTQNKDNLEILIPIQFEKGLQLKIPIRLSIYSILGSSVQFFGYNLDQDNVLKDFFNTLDGLNLINLNPSQGKELFPYDSKTPVLVCLVNAILTGKKIVVMSYTKPIMAIIEFILSLLMLMHRDEEEEILQYHTFPYFDISKMDLLDGLSSFIIGTTNPIFKNMTKTDGSGDNIWDVFIDLDSNEMSVQIQEDYNIIRSSTSSDPKQRHASVFSKASAMTNGTSSTTTGSNGNVPEKRQRSFNMRIPASIKNRFSKRNSVNSVESNSSLIDEYFKDDYDEYPDETNNIDEATVKDGFKFEFEKALLIYSNKNDFTKELDHTFLVDKVLLLNEKISNRQDDILIYIDFMKNVRFLGYEVILKTLKLSYNLNKLIAFRTFKYESEFKGINNYSKNINKALESLETSVIEMNNNYITLPYQFDIFQFQDRDKLILQYYNDTSMKFFKFIKLLTNLSNGFQEIDLKPMATKENLKYSLDMVYYIQTFFEMFLSINEIEVAKLEAFLKDFRESLNLATSNRQTGKTDEDAMITIFYQLSSIKTKIKFGNSVQDLSFIQILVILQKFVKTSDDCNLEINKILYKFKQQWYCSIKIDELVNDFVD